MFSCHKLVAPPATTSVFLKFPIMVKENHKLISQNERRIDGQTLSKINIGKLPIAININGHKGNVSVDKKISSNSKTKSSQQTIGIPVTVYHQNIRGLKGKANELLSQ